MTQASETWEIKMIEILTIIGDGQDPESLRNKFYFGLFIFYCVIIYIIYDKLKNVFGKTKRR